MKACHHGKLWDRYDSSYGAIVEILADEKGIVWPKSVTPYAVHIFLSRRVMRLLEMLLLKLLTNFIKNLQLKALNLSMMTAQVCVPEKNLQTRI